ncbi:MAG TPA: hypothetical protein VH640_31525 [Bryobacteraceae bacterium]
MAGARKPGPQCSYTDSASLDDGTICLTRTPAPGPLGTSSPGIPEFVAFDQCITRAYARAVQLAPSALFRETGYPFNGVADSFLAKLIDTLQPPADPPIESLLGPEFLRLSVQTNVGDVVCARQAGVSMAKHAAELRDFASEREVELAAEQLALAAGILMRLLLESIVAYVRSGTRHVNQHNAEQLVRQLRARKLGDGFANWVEENWAQLMNDSRLRANPRVGGPVVTERFIIQRKPRVPTATQPVSEPPTFPSDTDGMAQAATLIAAAAQGKPFCPE